MGSACPSPLAASCSYRTVWSVTHTQRVIQWDELSVCCHPQWQHIKVQVRLLPVCFPAERRFVFVRCLQRRKRNATTLVVCCPTVMRRNWAGTLVARLFSSRKTIRICPLLSTAAKEQCNDACCLLSNSNATQLGTYACWLSVFQQKDDSYLPVVVYSGERTTRKRLLPVARQYCELFVCYLQWQHKATQLVVWLSSNN